MLPTFRILCLATVLGMSVVAPASAQDDSVILQVREKAGTWEVGVPVSKLELDIPKGRLQAKTLKGTPTTRGTSC